MPCADLEKRREHYRLYRKRNPAQHLLLNKRYTDKLKVKVFTHYCGGTPGCMCPGCHTTFIHFLQMDHIDGKGFQHKVNGAKVTGKALWLWLIRSNYPEGFQVLCSNCNHAKRNKAKCPAEGESH